MKKGIILVPLVALFLTGCGEKKGTISCTLSSNDVVNGYQLDAEYTIHYKGDFAEYVESKEVITSSSEGTLANFESTFKNTYSTMDSSYGGYTIDIKNENGKVTSNVKIDYTKMDLDKLVQDNPSVKSYIKDKKMSKDGLQSTYKAMGATCSEK